MSPKYKLEKDLDLVRKEFPILDRCVYLISNSLGAVPREVENSLLRYYHLWKEQGVTAWKTEWWDLAKMVSVKIARIIGAEAGEVTMMSHSTQAHWVALSTLFGFSGDQKRNRIIMTELDFPSSIYAVSNIAEAMNWTLDIVPSEGKPGIDTQRILERIDDTTLVVATSHVYFKSAFIQNIAEIAAKARKFGAKTLIDGYHAPGVIPVDVHRLGVDFYVSGCLKWLCGGPGNAFLFVRSGPNEKPTPALTGWMAHSRPFSFDIEHSLAEDEYRFMSGTPQIPCFYSAVPGLDMILDVGIQSIRRKSVVQTRRILDLASGAGFEIYSSQTDEFRGGAVSLGIPHAFQVKQALEERKICIDFRKGRNGEPDVLRIGPHFYTLDQEIEDFFETVDDILSNQSYLKFSSEIKHVT